MKYRWILFLGFAAATVGAGLGQQSATNPVSESPSSSTANHVSTPIASASQRYQLRPGDSFDVDFALSPEFNQTVSVQPDGYGSLKGVGAIPVQGKTVPELTEAIRAAYAPTLHNPIIVVVLKDFDKPYFIASGQVAHPGKYDLRSETTVTEALAMAGWVSEKAKTSQIVLYRKSPDGSFEGKVLNVKKLLASRNLSEDPRMLPGDMLYVPQNVSSRLRPYLPTTSAGAYYNPAQN
jgi:polysaccharide export outer membrane protein